MGLGFKVEELKSNYRDFGFLSSPMIMRVPFVLLFGFNKGARKTKGQKGTTQEPSKGLKLGQKCKRWAQRL